MVGDNQTPNNGYPIDKSISQLLADLQKSMTYQTTIEFYKKANPVLIQSEREVGSDSNSAVGIAHLWWSRFVCTFFLRVETKFYKFYKFFISLNVL